MSVRSPKSPTTFSGRARIVMRVFSAGGFGGKIEEERDSLDAAKIYVRENWRRFHHRGIYVNEDGSIEIPFENDPSSTTS